MSAFYFWLKPIDAQLNYQNKIDYLEIDNLRYRESFIFEATPIFNLFQLCKFSVKIHNVQNDIDKKSRSTISIINNYEIEIDCYVSPTSYVHIENEILEQKIQHLRFEIKNSLNLEIFSKQLLSKTNA